MRRLVIVCEGKTERNLVNGVLCERLIKSFESVSPKTLPTGRNPRGGTAKGGFRSANGYAFALKELCNLIALEKDAIITTLFDLYGFPQDIPCASASETDPLKRAQIYANQIQEDVTKKFDSGICFVPYVQPCETEAFLFVNPGIAARRIGDNSDDMQRIEEYMRVILGKYLTPEHINTNCGPSQHLERIYPKLCKGKAGKAGLSWQVVKEIGIDTVMNCCETFQIWLLGLEELGRASR